MDAIWKAHVTLVLGLLVGCGGYDPEYDCEQTLECQIGKASAYAMSCPGGVASDANVELCADVSEAVYDDATDAEQDTIDAAYDACAEKTRCAYLDCIEAELWAPLGGVP